MQNKIREIRLARRMTQIELSRRAQVTQPFLHDLELGRRGAKPETYERIADALEVDVSEIKGESA